MGCFHGSETLPPAGAEAEMHLGTVAVQAKGRRKGKGSTEWTENDSVT